MAKEEKINFLDEIRKFQNKDLSVYTSHALLGVSLDQNGSPEGTVTLIHGTPTEILGMIKLVKFKLEKYEKELIDKIFHSEKGHDLSKPREKIEDSKKRLDELIDKLPPGIKEKIQAVKEKFDKAIESDDIPALEKLQSDIMSEIVGKENLDSNFLKERDPDNEDDFSIEDFKG